MREAFARRAPRRTRRPVDLPTSPGAPRRGVDLDDNVAVREIAEEEPRRGSGPHRDPLRRQRPAARAQGRIAGARRGATVAGRGPRRRGAVRSLGPRAERRGPHRNQPARLRPAQHAGRSARVHRGAAGQRQRGAGSARAPALGPVHRTVPAHRRDREPRAGRLPGRARRRARLRVGEHRTEASPGFLGSAGGTRSIPFRPAPADRSVPDGTTAVGAAPAGCRRHPPPVRLPAVCRPGRPARWRRGWRRRRPSRPRRRRPGSSGSAGRSSGSCPGGRAPRKIIAPGTRCEHVAEVLGAHDRVLASGARSGADQRRRRWQCTTSAADVGVDRDRVAVARSAPPPSRRGRRRRRSATRREPSWTAARVVSRQRADRALASRPSRGSRCSWCRR